MKKSKKLPMAPRAAARGRKAQAAKPDGTAIADESLAISTATWHDLSLQYVKLMNAKESDRAALIVAKYAPRIEIDSDGFERFARALYRNKAYELMADLASKWPPERVPIDPAVLLFVRALANQHQIEQALDLLAPQIAADPENAEFAQHQMLLQMRLRDSEPAPEDSISENETLLRNYRKELAQLVQAGEHESVISLIEKVIAAGHTPLNLLMIAANAAFELGNKLLAISYLEQAVSEYPTYPLPKLQLVELLDGQGRYADGLVHCEAALQIVPQHRRLVDLRRALIEKLSDRQIDTGARVKLLPLPTTSQRDKQFQSSSLGSLFFFFRVIWNLALRQIRLRHPRTAFGPLLILIEPIAYVISLWLALEFLLARGRPPIGEHWVFFYATGIIPYLLFTHLASSGARGRMPFKTLLEVPLIRPMSLLLASALAEFLIVAAAGSLLFGAFYLFGLFASVNDVYGILSAFVAAWLLGIGFMMMNFGICSFLPVWQTAWLFIQRALFFASCIFFMAQSVPKPIRDVLVWNPLLICIEWFRHGFYNLYNPPWLDRSYLIMCIGLFLLLGIALQSLAAKYRER